MSFIFLSNALITVVVVSWKDGCFQPVLLSAMRCFNDFICRHTITDGEGPRLEGINDDHFNFETAQHALDEFYKNATCMNNYPR